MRIEIEVSQEHIDESSRMSHVKCAIALAVLDAFEWLGIQNGVSVSKYGVVILKRGSLDCLERSPLPVWVLEWLELFDGSNEVPPIRFLLKMPEGLNAPTEEELANFVKFDSQGKVVSGETDQ